MQVNTAMVNVFMNHCGNWLTEEESAVSRPM